MKVSCNRFWQGRCHKKCLWLYLVLILTASEIFAAEFPRHNLPHHDLHVRLQPSESRIIVIDNIQLPTDTDSIEFTLRKGLTVEAAGAELVSLGQSRTGRLHHYRINRLPADGKVRLSYRGKIVSAGTEGPFDMPESVLNSEAVYLDSSSAWLPDFENRPLFTFDMQVEAPRHWQMISQGKSSRKNSDGTASHRFSMPHPQDSIYLLGGLYQRYSKKHDDVEIEVYLYRAGSTSADSAALAEKYLQTSSDYISLYSDWIGPYPYARFAVVENRWQTGYGMPSFTLLGSRVIRFPFILNTSLPHEIVHNWWGNGVYVNHSKGNWSEGLTAYMADHYNKEQQGKGREYRRKALERYANFAAEKGDFALTDFRSRHDEASQAVGYSKSLMLIHMLQKQSGEEAFDKSLREFWQQYRFKYANFLDLIQLLYSPLTETTNKKKGYQQFAEQWLYRAGAPDVSLDNVSVSKQDDDYLLSIKISQHQAGPAYQLQLPLEVTLLGKTWRENIFLTEKNQLHTLKLKQAPQTVTLDPDYDVFRLLHPNERPASLGRLFGAKKQLLVLPTNSTTEQLKAWQQLASAWAKQYDNVELIYDNQIKNEEGHGTRQLPEDAAIWLLGWNNVLLKAQLHRFNTQAQSHVQAQKLTGTTATIDKQELHINKHAVVLLDTDNTRTPMGFIGAADPATITSLARKLPHYSSYGTLAFKLPEVNNIIKQHLPVLKSPMSWELGQE